MKTLVTATLLMSALTFGCKQNHETSDAKTISDMVNENEADTQSLCPSAKGAVAIGKVALQGSAAPRTNQLANVVQNIPAELRQLFLESGLVSYTFEPSMKAACGEDLQEQGFCARLEDDTFHVGIVNDGSAAWQHEIIKSMGAVLSQLAITEGSVEKALLPESSRQTIYDAFIKDLSTTGMSEAKLSRILTLDFSSWQEAADYRLGKDNMHDDFVVSRIIAESFHSAHHCDAAVADREKRSFPQTLNALEQGFVSPIIAHVEAARNSVDGFGLLGITEAFGAFFRGITPGSGSFMNFREAYQYASMDDYNPSYGYRNMVSNNWSGGSNYYGNGGVYYQNSGSTSYYPSSCGYSSGYYYGLLSNQ